jgi:hypothetical protein
MLKKRLLSISLLLPLVAMSVTARAGSTITDKSRNPGNFPCERQSPSSRTDQDIKGSPKPAQRGEP